VEEPQTNLVFFDTTGTGMTAEALSAKARLAGLRFSASGKYRGRACTHLNVSAAQVDEAVEILRHVATREHA
jgi:threonine aldolase